MDSGEAFEPVVQLNVLFHVVGTFVSLGWQVHNVDNFTALLDGNIDVELYVVLDSSCYNLNRSLYGLN